MKKIPFGDHAYGHIVNARNDGTFVFRVTDPETGKKVDYEMGVDDLPVMALDPEYYALYVPEGPGDGVAHLGYSRSPVPDTPLPKREKIRPDCKTIESGGAVSVSE